MEKQISQKYLPAYGWNKHWEEAMNTLHFIERGFVPGRVIAQFSQQYQLITECGEVTAGVSGKFEFNAVDRIDFPAVGDWVDLLQSEARAVIHAVLPRRTSMIRKEAGNRTDGQVIGANIDSLFIVNALNQDFNLRKIERYLIAAWESGAQPVILLTKADLCSNLAESITSVQNIAPGVPVHAVSALQNQGRDDLAPYLLSGSTIAITGSSGVGKSTLLNWLAGQDLQAVQDIREHDARGRHTTTHRQLFLLPSGAIMMDTPGMRELQLWETESGWHTAFGDIEQLAAQCRFRDCRHDTEIGCAVKQALEDQSLDRRRYANYLKTRKELAYLERKEKADKQRMKKNLSRKR